MATVDAAELRLMQDIALLNYGRSVQHAQEALYSSEDGPRVADYEGKRETKDLYDFFSLAIKTSTDPSDPFVCAANARSIIGRFRRQYPKTGLNETTGVFSDLFSASRSHLVELHSEVRSLQHNPMLEDVYLEGIQLHP
jgi:hypothetical protein